MKFKENMRFPTESNNSTSKNHGKTLCFKASIYSTLKLLIFGRSLELWINRAIDLKKNQELKFDPPFFLHFVDILMILSILIYIFDTLNILGKKFLFEFERPQC